MGFKPPHFPGIMDFVSGMTGSFGCCEAAGARRGGGAAGGGRGMRRAAQTCCGVRSGGGGGGRDGGKTAKSRNYFLQLSFFINSQEAATLSEGRMRRGVARGEP